MSKHDDFISVQPLQKWPNATFEPDRPEAVFTARMNDTFALLRREVRMLGGRIVTLRVAISLDDCNNGRPKKEIKPRHPGVVIEFSSDHGELSYCCDKFDQWQDNLRAVALTLERLRKAQAYGVITGQQYVGNATALPAPAREEGLTYHEAVDWLAKNTGFTPDEIKYTDARKKAFRKAKRAMHPDAGGKKSDWLMLCKVDEKINHPVIAG